MRRIRAIIFDMDGVLIEAKGWHYDALNEALGLFGFAITRADHVTKYDGLPTKAKLRLLNEERAFPKSLAKFVDRLKQEYTLKKIDRCACSEAIQQTAMSKLRQDSYLLGVASNSVRRTVDLVMRKCDISKYFDFTLSNQDVEKPKPDPEIYVKAIERTGFSASECLVVEDNPFGITAARRAGAHVLRVGGVEDVTYERIRDFICHTERAA